MKDLHQWLSFSFFPQEEMFKLKTSSGWNTNHTVLLEKNLYLNEWGIHAVTIWFKPRKVKKTKSLCINWEELGRFKIYPKTRLKPNNVRCWCQRIVVFYLIVEEAKRRKEKREREKEVFLYNMHIIFQSLAHAHLYISPRACVYTHIYTNI